LIEGAFVFLPVSVSMTETMKAPEFPRNLRWFNLPKESSSQSLSMKDLRGRVVLVDFWTYSCVNCLRTLPYVKEWHERYAKAGLTIIGVHTPEFEFEKDVSNVQAALKKFGIAYPVVMDSDYQIWSLYSDDVWPRKFLINKDGQIVYDHSGEGEYKETEEAIQEALLEVNPKLKLPKPTGEDGAGGICYPATPETYLGAMRGRQGETWSVFGEWKIYPEFIEHVRKTETFADYLLLNFKASEVNLVMEARTERPAKLRLELNGEFIKELEVLEPRMYNLVQSDEFLNGRLKIFVKDAGLRAYAFTFGSCLMNEPKDNS
jgi:thiol-disulfide isomerase/thioredoxin